MTGDSPDAFSERAPSASSSPDRFLSLDAAVEALRAGRLVGVPTETVYGLAADAQNDAAVAAIFAAKERPRFNPLICHLPDAEAVFRLAAPSSPESAALARSLAEAFWPGPLTLLLPHAGRIPSIVTAGSPLAGFRVPAHPLTSELLRRVGTPLAAPSANRFGRRSPVTAEMVLADLAHRPELAGVLDGGPCGIGVESSVAVPVSELRRIGAAAGLVDATGLADAGRADETDEVDLVLLREGGVTREALAATGVRVGVPTSGPEPGAASRDAGRPATIVGTPTGAPDLPGLLHAPGRLVSHYAPGAPLVLYTNEDPAALAAALQRLEEGSPANRRGPVRYLAFGNAPTPPGCEARDTLSATGDLAEAARRLFALFDQPDAAEARALVARPLPERELGRAVNDRLRRAAAVIV